MKMKITCMSENPFKDNLSAIIQFVIAIYGDFIYSHIFFLCNKIKTLLNTIKKENFLDTSAIGPKIWHFCGKHNVKDICISNNLSIKYQFLTY